MENYHSPFGTRYNNPEISHIWSEISKRRLWRFLWLSLLMKHVSSGMVTDPGILISPLFSLIEPTDEQYESALRSEEITKHDLVAELAVFKSILPDQVASRLHAGATSSDIEDIADLIRLRASIAICFELMSGLENALAGFVAAYAWMPILGRTHLVPAEPTTVGYRFASYLEQLAEGSSQLVGCYPLKSRPVAGAVGTRSNQLMLHKSTTFTYEDIFLDNPLEGDHILSFGQTYPRVIEYRIATALAGISATLYKMAFDIRLMHSEGTIEEGSSSGQVGSSAMPTKKNPITAELICSLSRRMPGYASDLWGVAAMSALERTLDDSAGRRCILPEMFLSFAHQVSKATELIRHLVVNEDACQDGVITHNFVNAASKGKASAISIGETSYFTEKQGLYLEVATYMALETVKKSVISMGCDRHFLEQVSSISRKLCLGELP